SSAPTSPGSSATPSICGRQTKKGPAARGRCGLPRKGSRRRRKCAHGPARPVQRLPCAGSACCRRGSGPARAPASASPLAGLLPLAPPPLPLAPPRALVLPLAPRPRRAQAFPTSRSLPSPRSLFPDLRRRRDLGRAGHHKRGVPLSPLPRLSQLPLQRAHPGLQGVDLALHAPEHLLQRIRQVGVVQVDDVHPAPV